MSFFLKCVEGPLAGQSFPLRAGSIVLGRQNTNEIILQSPRVSRRHAEIMAQGELLFLRDLQSQNGTFLNGTKLEANPLNLAVEVRFGDQISLGDYIFEIAANGHAESHPMMQGAPHAAALHFSAEGSPDFLPRTAALLFKVFRVERVCILFLDATEKTLKPAFFAHATQGGNHAFEPSMLALHHVLNEKRAIFTVDAEQDVRFKDSQTINAGGVRAIMCAPIMKAKNLVGAIYADTLQSEHQLTPQHVQWLEAIADLVGSSLKNH